MNENENEDDKDNKSQKKIQIFNNKDGTYNRKDCVDDFRFKCNVFNSRHLPKQTQTISA